MITDGRTDGRFEQLRRDASASSKYTDITSSLFIGTGFAVNSSDFNYPGSILAKHFFKNKVYCVFGFFFLIRSFQMKVVHVI